MHNKTIISTRPLSEEIISLAKSHAIEILVHSFIDTEPVINESIFNFLDQKITAIFTSMNAVDSVVDQLQGAEVHWKTAAIGNTTKELATKHFGELVATGNNASELAKNLVKENGPFVFFCGDQRRDELPGIFHQHNKPLTELVVYKTIKHSASINQHFDGILFYSPSAVDSFFENNSLKDDVTVFAIGTTTAETIRTYVNNEIIVADQPGKENLVRTMIKYYNNK